MKGCSGKLVDSSQVIEIFPQIFSVSCIYVNTEVFVIFDSLNRAIMYISCNLECLSS